MANRLGNNGGRSYDSLFQPVKIDCNFVVDATNTNGLGISSLKGGMVRNVFMHTSAAFTGTYNNSTSVTSIADTSALTVGMPVQGTGIPVGAKIASIVSSTAITLSAATTGGSTTGSITYQGLGNNGVPNPNPAVGYALIQLKENYFRYAGNFNGFAAPVTGGALAINGTALTVGQPYVITSVGHASNGTVTIAPVADSSGSLASTYFVMYDAYGNKYVIWFSVSGVGSAPVGVSGTLVQQSISTNDTAATIGTALTLTLENLLAAQPGNPSAPAGVYSFTASGTTTVTVVSTQNGPLPGGPADGAIATGFTFAVTKDQSNIQNWQAVGVPAGVVPAVGVSFIAKTTGYSSRGGSTGLVKLPGVAGGLTVEVVGDPNLSLNPVPMGGSPNVGGWITIQFLAPSNTAVTSVLTMDSYTPAGVITNGTPDTFAGTPAVLTGTIVNSGGVASMALKAPTSGSIAGASFCLESKSVVVAGE